MLRNGLIIENTLENLHNRKGEERTIGTIGPTQDTFSVDPCIQLDKCSVK